MLGGESSFDAPEYKALSQRARVARRLFIIRTYVRRRGTTMRKARDDDDILTKAARVRRMTNAHAQDDDAPLPLQDLSDRLSENTFAWLCNEEAEQEETPAAANNIFDNENEYYQRVHSWTSSTSNPDGIGDYKENTHRSHEDDAVSVKYILSDASGGHGDDLWAASRHVSNLLANHETCRQLLNTNNNHDHPLLGMTFLELGAGGGVPSWTAMKCGARVVCTDQPIANRIRCMAESAQRNLGDMISELSSDDERLVYAQQARVCPYLWGDLSVEKVTCGEDDKLRFDVIVAADCIYNPKFQPALLDSIQRFMAQDGVALLPFALHGNTDDEKVWNILELAKTEGWNVETLESQQLSPQAKSMNPKRGLVHMLRLTRK